MSTATLDVRAASDDELAALYGTDDETARAAALAEADRRDRAAQRRLDRRMQDTAYVDAWHAQYEDAVRECNGQLLNHRGIRAGVEEQALWTGPESRALAYASDELAAYWSEHGRLTVTAWRDGLAADRRAERDTASSEQPRTEKPMIGERIARAAIREAGRTPARDWAAESAAIRQRIAQRQQDRTASRQVEHAAVAVRDMAAAQPVPVRRERQHLDGEAVLGYTRAWLANYARWPSEAALDLATLWAAHACARDSDGVLIWEATPRLMFLSSDPGSGKSRALELVSLLVSTRYGLLTEPTAAALAHILGPQHEAVFLDEADLLFGRGARRAGIRALLNAGYTRAGVIVSMRGGKVNDLPVFGAVALAGLDVLSTSTGGSLAPLLSRAVIVRMRKSDERIPQLTGKTRNEGGLLHAALTAWAQQERETLTGEIPEMPDWLTGRAAEIWEPLFRVAHAAGGDWPRRAEMAAEDLALAAEAGEAGDGDLMDGLATMAAGWTS